MFVWFFLNNKGGETLKVSRNGAPTTFLFQSQTGQDFEQPDVAEDVKMPLLIAGGLD